MDADHYATLGVDPGATAEEIKQRYRQGALDCHPDRHPNDAVAEARFKRISEAYQVLGDADRRKAYDEARRREAPASGPWDAEDFFDRTRDVFNSLFQKAPGASAPAASSGRVGGRTMKARHRITLREAAFGAKVEVPVAFPDPCGACGGHGADPSSGSVECSACKGRGQVTRGASGLRVSAACEPCRGAGRVRARPCASCSGRGAVRRTKTLRLIVPAGVEDGQVIRLAGQGEAGAGGAPAGDLLLTLEVLPHEAFTREGHDLHALLTLPFHLAALGGLVEINHLDDSSVQVTVPAGTQPGEELRLEGLGALIPGAAPVGGRGDLVVTVGVEVPRKLSPKSRKALQAYVATLAPRDG